MSIQLALNLRLKDTASFDNFLPERNQEIIDRLHAVLLKKVTVPVFFLWGEIGCGKTHLLQAVCRALTQSGRPPVYIPFSDSAMLTTDLLENAEQNGVVCVDDLDRVAGNNAWEAALFGLYERLRASDGTLVVAAKANPSHLRLVMPEFATRLGSGLVYKLNALDDDDKIAAINLRARNRGLKMDRDVVPYILARYPRDTHSLFNLLDRIDQQSLASQRRVTIPFIRELDRPFGEQ